MMNYVEEQENELEALNEIYYNEIQVTSNKQPISFSIKVRPQASTYEEPEAEIDGDRVDDSDDESTGSEDLASTDPSVVLKFKLPPKYPDEKPYIEILDSENLNEDELDELFTFLNEKAEESLGGVMIFMLVSDVVEWLIAVSEKEANEIQKEKDRKIKEEEEEERRKQDGTLVTEKTFLAWKAKFDAEMLKLKLEQQKKLISEQGVPGSRGLTGREMFESDKTLAESDLNFVEDLEQEQIEALLQNIDEFEIDEGEGFDLGDITGDEDDSDDDDYDIEDEDESEPDATKQSGLNSKR